MNKRTVLVWVATLAVASYAGGQAETARAAVSATAMATVPASRAAQSSPATRGLTETMSFEFENASIDAVLDEMSARLGFVIQRTVTLTGKISVRAPKPVDADEAMTLLNSLLVPLGYAALERPAVEVEGGRVARVLRVMTWEAAKKEAPVRGR